MRRILRFAAPAILVAATLGAGLDVGAIARTGPPEGGTWHAVADGPLSPRSGAAAVWTGQEFLVFGGHSLRCDEVHCFPRAVDFLTDGAAYDPEDDSWRRIANFPLRTDYASTAVAGGKVYVSAQAKGGPEPGDGPSRWFAYDIGDDTWTALPSPGPGGWPLAVGETLLAVNSGRGAIRVYEGGGWAPVPASSRGRSGWPVSDGASKLYAVRDRLAVLDVATRRWSKLPDPPIDGHGPFHFAGGRVVIPYEMETLRAAIYDPAIRRWKTLERPAEEASWPDANNSFLYPERAAGDALIMSARRYLHVPTLSWRPIAKHTALGGDPDPFVDVAEQAVAWSGKELFVWGGTSRWNGPRPPTAVPTRARRPSSATQAGYGGPRRRDRDTAICGRTPTTTRAGPRTSSERRLALLRAVRGLVTRCKSPDLPVRQNLGVEAQRPPGRWLPRNNDGYSADLHFHG